MSLQTTLSDIQVRQADGTVTPAPALVLGLGLPLRNTPLGVPELLTLEAGIAVLMPSGGDDTAALQAVLNANSRVRLGPGVFQLSSTVTVPSGTWLRGSGVDQTEVRFSQTTAALSIARSTKQVWIEGFTLTGPGRLTASTGQGAIHSAGTAIRGVTLRDLVVQDFGTNGIRLQDVSDVTLFNVTVRRTGTNAIWLNNGSAGADRAYVADVLLEDVGGSLALTNVYHSVVSGIRVKNVAGDGISISGGGAHTIAGAAITTATGVGVVLSSFTSATVEGVQVTGVLHGYWLQSLNGVTVSGCGAANCSGSPIRVVGGTGVTIDGFRSDQSARATTQAHLLVNTAATGVFVPNFQLVNSTTIPAIEVDVAAAGGRVVFIQNNITPARVNGAANFTQL